VAAQDNSPVGTIAPEPAPAAVPTPSSPEAPIAAPLFRTRQDIPKVTPSSIPAVIPILRAPDDPGVDDEGGRDEFAEQIGPPQGQVGGWRGFLSRWGG
jgi:HemY protein